jgi:hypothetical protein
MVASLMAEDPDVARKVRKVVQLLLLPRPRSPGVKGWELRRAVGKEYAAILELVRSELARLDLQLKQVTDDTVSPDGSDADRLDRSRYFVLLKHAPTASDLTATGWRVDELALLAAAIAYLHARHGRAPRKEVEQLLKDRFPAWRVDASLQRFVRRGYLALDEQTLTTGWRSHAEIDPKALVTLLLGSARPAAPVN